MATDKKRISAEDRLSACIDSLTELKNSGYIPFASPNPSYTEVVIRDSITVALAELGRALELHKAIYKDSAL